MSVASSGRELPDAIYAQITALSDRGNELSENGEYEAALAEYEAALRLVPNPKDPWEAASWLYTAVGDCHFLLGRFEQACDALSKARNCADGHGDPFINLRLGQALFERDELAQAKEALLQAYMLEGEEIFNDEDPKYLDFLRSTVKLTN